MIDLRRVRVGVEVLGRLNWYEGLRIRATGTKYADPTQNDCVVTISGLSMAVRDSLISASETSTRKLVLEAGRVSSGLSRIFIGDVFAAEPSSPPDVDLVLRAKTSNALAKKIAVVPGQAKQPLSAIARSAAANLGVALDFQATEKTIGNFAFSGPAIKQVERLQESGAVQAFIDDDILIVKDAQRPLTGRVRRLSMDSGMVGIPKKREDGIEVTYLVDGPSDLGGVLYLESVYNKSLNGGYSINQLQFDITTHEDAFFYTALCTPI